MKLPFNPFTLRKQLKEAYGLLSERTLQLEEAKAHSQELIQENLRLRTEKVALEEKIINLQKQLQEHLVKQLIQENTRA